MISATALFKRYALSTLGTVILVAAGASHAQIVGGAVSDNAKPVQVPAVHVTAGEEDKYAADPAEGFNRGIYKFNEKVDDYALAPVARGYRKGIPQWGRDRVHSALDNLSAPNYFINSALQGDVNGVFTSFWRFVINSTFGIAGMYDVAAQAGLKPMDKDFGQTLGKYGMSGDPYLMLPLLGPSSPRDAIGLAVDSVTNPFNYFTWPAVVAIRGTDIIDKRERTLDITDDIQENAFDPYAALRSMYKQNREKVVNEAKSE